MNTKSIRFILGWILNIEALLMLLPVATAVVYREEEGVAYALVMAVCAAVGALMTYKKPNNPSFYAKEGFVCTALGWILMSAFGCVPFMLTGEIPSFIDAMFEMVSGFTTTGASVVLNVEELSRELGCKIVEISALKGEGIMEAAEAAVQAAKSTKTVPMHTFSGPVEHAIAHIEEAAVHNLPEEQQRWYAIKIFERDDKVLDQLKIDPTVMAHIEEDIKAAEKELDDDAESIITNERYVYIAEIIKACYKKKNAGQLSASDKIDRIVTNRWLGLPIFAAVMFLVYYISMVTVGSAATDWANDGLFGDGWHLFGIGSGEYNEVSEAYGNASLIVDGYEAYIEENGALAADGTFTYDVEDEETLAVTTETATLADYEKAKATLDEIGDEPDPADYGVWVPGVPVLVGNALEAVPAPGLRARPAEVRVEIARTPDALIYDVRDNGTGLSAEAAERLRDGLFTTKKDGTGFGLLGTRKALLEMGGRLLWENLPDSGALFRIVLPLRVERTPAAAEANHLREDS